MFALPSPSFAQDSSDASYQSAVKQFRSAGFEGVDNAVKSFESIIARDKSFIPAYIASADAYLLKYEFSKKKNKQWLKKANALLDKAIEKDGNNSVAYFKRAITLFTLGKVDGGVRDVKKAIDIRSDYLEPRILYLQHLLSTKNGGEARKFARSSLNVYPKNPAPMKYFAERTPESYRSFHFSLICLSWFCSKSPDCSIEGMKRQFQIR